MEESEVNAKLLFTYEILEFSFTGISYTTKMLWQK